MPNIDSSLYGQTLKLESLTLPGGRKLSVTVLPTDEKTTVSYKITGGEGAKALDVVIALPEGSVPYILRENITREEHGYSNIVSASEGTKTSSKAVFSTASDDTAPVQTTDADISEPETTKENPPEPAKTDKTPLLIALGTIAAVTAAAVTAFILIRKKSKQ